MRHVTEYSPAKTRDNLSDIPQFLNNCAYCKKYLKDNKQPASIRSHQINDLLATDKSRYFTQPRQVNKLYYYFLMHLSGPES